jgi:hypothetical protein
MSEAGVQGDLCVVLAVVAEEQRGVGAELLRFRASTSDSCRISLIEI